MPNHLIEVARKLAKRGPGFIGSYIKDVVLFDVVNGTDTRGRKTGNSTSDENIYYVPSFTSVITQTLELVRQSLGETFADWQFVDVGSGKGKVVLVYAKRYGAQAKHAPIGIEYDPELAAIANANIAKLGLAQTDAAVHVDDARNLRAHSSAPGLVLFLYNPFFGSLFHEFIASLKDIPHVMIYVDPVEKDHLVANGYKIEAEHPGKYNANTWLIASKSSVNA